MENKISLSVILPIKSAKAKDFDELFGKAINSLKEQKVDFEELVIVHTQEETLITVSNKALTLEEFPTLREAAGLMASFVASSSL
jgi:hypothetical protein